MIINGKLQVTPTHMIYVNNMWKAAEEIKIGDILQGINGEEILVHNIKEWVWRQADDTSDINDLTRSWSSTGSYDVTLTVRDNGGLESSDAITIDISSNNPDDDGNESGDGAL